MDITSGDGGSGESAGATRLSPQRLDTVVGKVLRIRPDGQSVTGTYAIPTDNPFVDVAAASYPRLYSDARIAKAGIGTLVLDEVNTLKGVITVEEGTRRIDTRDSLAAVPEPALVASLIPALIAASITLRPAGRHRRRAVRG